MELKKVNKDLLLANFYRWVKLIGITGATQVIIQAIGFVSGILIIRMLPTEEYALYTLANTILGTLAVLSNSGVSTGVIAEGGKVWKDNVKLGVVMATGLHIKKKFVIISLVIGIPVLFYLLIKNEASLLMTIMIIISLIPAFMASVSNSLLEIAPKLQQDIVSLQKNQLAINFGRLFLLGLSIFVFPFAFIAILASGIPMILGNLKLRKIASKHADYNQQPSEEIRNNIMSTVKRILPQAIYFSLAGQITILLLSVFGTTSSVAQIGALSRVAMILSLFAIMFNTLIAPRFARLKEDFKILLIKYIQIVSIVFIIFFVIVILTNFFSRQILFVLGDKYATLETEMVLVVIGNSLGVMCGIIYQLYSSRGWVLNPILSISINIGALLLGILLTDVSTLKGVIFLTIIIEVILLVTNSFYGFYKIFKLKELN